MPRAAAVYCRISEDRNGDQLGVTRQLEDCRALCAARGWPVAAEFIDNDVSAFDGKKRPGYGALLRAISEGRVDTVVAWHPDRLHRHPIELNEFIPLIEAHRVKVAMVRAGEWDLSTPSGRVTARIMGDLARYESEQKADRASRKHQQIAEAGRWAGGTRPYGYRIHTDMDGQQRTDIVPEEADVIHEAKRRVLSGQSLVRIVEDFNVRKISTVKGRRWSRHVLRQLLLHPRLAGFRALHQRRVEMANGKARTRWEMVGTYKAQWKPILTAAEHARLKVLLTDPARTTTRALRAYLLTGLLYCGACGAKLVTRPSDGKRAHCCDRKGCGRISILAEPLETFVAEAVMVRLDTPALSRALRSGDGDHMMKELLGQVAEDEAQLTELATAYGNRKISMREWETARKTIEARVTKLRAQLARTDRQTAVRELAGRAGELRRRWPALDLDQRRSILTALLTRLTIRSAVPGLNRFDPTRVEPLWKL